MIDRVEPTRTCSPSSLAYPVEHHHRYQLFFQLTRITRDKGALAKDDRLDALAMAVAY